MENQERYVNPEISEIAVSISQGDEPITGVEYARALVALGIGDDKVVEFTLSGLWSDDP